MKIANLRLVGQITESVAFHMTSCLLYFLVIFLCLLMLFTSDCLEDKNLGEEMMTILNSSLTVFMITWPFSVRRLLTESSTSVTDVVVRGSYWAVVLIYSDPHETDTPVQKSPGYCVLTGAHIESVCSRRISPHFAD